LHSKYPRRGLEEADRSQYAGGFRVKNIAERSNLSGLVVLYGGPFLIVSCGSTKMFVGLCISKISNMFILYREAKKEKEERLAVTEAAFLTDSSSFQFATLDVSRTKRTVVLRASALSQSTVAVSSPSFLHIQLALDKGIIMMLSGMRENNTGHTSGSNGKVERQLHRV